MSYAENDTGVTVETYTANDPDTGDSISWGLSGTDADSFTIPGGALTFKSSPDYETKDSYSVTVEATGGGTLSDTRAVTVTITNVDEAPTWDTTPTGVNPTSVSYDENGTAAVATYAATDPESQSVTWGLSGTDAGSFTIPGGALTFNSSPNYETKDSYSVTVEATAGLKSTLDVTVTIADVNEAPTITGGATSVSYAENGTGVTVETYTANDPDAGDGISWSLEGADHTSFDFGGGVLQFEASPDFETKRQYDVTVKAADDAGLHDTRAVRITITDVDEAPVVTGGTAVSHAENTGPTVGTYTALDPEGHTITGWTLSGTDADDFSISDGVLRFSLPDTNSQPDYESPQDSSSDRQCLRGHGGGHRRRAHGHPRCRGDRHQRRRTARDHEFRNRELRGERNRDRGQRPVPVDPENDPITGWTLSGADAGDFTLSGSGELRFNSVPDYEAPADADTSNDYQITISTSDGKVANTVTQDMTITVTNVNEAPTVTGPDEPSKSEGSTDLTVATYNATDPDRGDTVDLSLSGDDANSFNFSGGTLSFKTVPDRNPPGDNDDNNIYEVSITATDAAGLTHTLGVHVTVTDVNEAPTITGGAASVQFAENDTAAVSTYTATDPERRRRRLEPGRPRQGRVPHRCRRRAELQPPGRRREHRPAGLREPGRRGHQQRVQRDRSGRGRRVHRHAGGDGPGDQRERGAGGDRPGRGERGGGHQPLRRHLRRRGRQG